MRSIVLDARSTCLALGLTAGLLSVACGASNPTVKSNAQASESKTQAPIAFEFQDREEKLWRSVDNRGKPLVVTLFTSWCRPCLVILQQLDATRTIPTYRDEFEVVAVSMDQKLGPLLDAFVTQLDLQYPVLIADAKTRHGHGPFGRIVAVPTTYVIDSDGRLIDTLVGGAPIDHIVRRAVGLKEEKQ